MMLKFGAKIYEKDPFYVFYPRSFDKYLFSSFWPILPPPPFACTRKHPPVLKNTSSHVFSHSRMGTKVKLHTKYPKYQFKKCQFNRVSYATNSPLGTTPNVNVHKTFKIHIYVHRTSRWRWEYVWTYFERPADVHFRCCAQWECSWHPGSLSNYFVMFYVTVEFPIVKDYLLRLSRSGLSNCKKHVDQILISLNRVWHTFIYRDTTTL